MAHERARERELHRYYQPWLETFCATALPTLSRSRLSREDSYVPQTSTDKTLISFAQLGALRLGGMRGMITLIDGNTQHILSEATKTLSLMDDSIHDLGDELLLGNAMLPRGHGVSEYALRPTEYTARDPDGTTFKARALVVADTTLDDRFKTKAFSGSGITFYAGVPLTTRLGHPIGVYSITDNKPRLGITAQELRFMFDMSCIVIQHLEIIKNERARARGERLVQGIGTFIEECHSSGAATEQDDGLEQDKLLPVISITKHTSKNHERPKLERTQSSGSKFKGLAISDASGVGRRNYSSYADEGPPKLPGDERHMHNLEADLSNKESPEQPTVHKTLGSVKGKTAKEDAASPPAGMEDPKYQREIVFDRASKILRKSLGADGVIFLDASSVNLSQGAYRQEKGSTKTQTTKSPTGLGQTPNPTSAVFVDASRDAQDTEDSVSTDDQESSHKQSRAIKQSQPCELIAGSFHDADSQTGIRLSQRTLRKLLRRHPQGGCYSFDEDGSDEGSESAVSAEIGDRTTASSDTSGGIQKSLARKHPLLNMLPGARTVVFLPLWDLTRDRWNSAAIIWSSHPARLMNIREDKAYLTAFGNSVMNELARLNLLVANSAKANFLANISHELRSPLHGILGSIEFLHESPMDDFQSNMVINVESCSKTLLDTINHVLDFTKLNLPSKKGHQGINQPITSDSSLTSAFDLAVVVEEAVEAVYAGQVFRTADADALEGRGPPLSSYTRAMQKRQDTKTRIALGQAALAPNVRLTLNIDYGINWHISSQPGAIRRIIMNLLGNSLKYTEKGSINVSLELDKSRPEPEDSHLHAVIIVSDTGKGMSENFVNHHAFTAFRQENSLTSGTGLGLSIIRQIVDSLGGKIDMQSQKDVGTEMKIWLSLQISHTKPERTILNQVQERTGGLMMCLLEPRGDQSSNLESESPTSRIGLGTTSTVHDSLRNLTSQWFSMYVFTAPSMDNVTADFFVYAEPPAIEHLLHKHGDNSSGAETPVLIFCQNAFQANCLRANGIHNLTEISRIIEVIAQPVGPQKLAKVLQRCFQRRKKLDAPSVATSSEHVTRSVQEDEEFKEPPPHAPKPSKEGSWTSEAKVTRPLRGPPKQTFSEDGPREPTVSRVLVVDDNDINLQLLIAFVRRAKLLFEPASNGLEALEAYKRSAFTDSLRFKYVFMDISMPVMDGITACREIRKFEKQEGIEKPAEVFALTGMGEESHIKEEAMNAGFTKFLTKPIRFQVLSDMLV